MKNLKISFENAMYIKAEESYSKLVLDDGKSNFFSRPMKHFTDALLESGWFKIHKSYIVNPNFIAHICDDCEKIHLYNGIILPISRRKRTSVLKWRSNSISV